jgi:hypothetical protein
MDSPSLLWKEQKTMRLGCYSCFQALQAADTSTIVALRCITCDAYYHPSCWATAGHCYRCANTAVVPMDGILTLAPAPPQPLYPRRLEGLQVRYVVGPLLLTLAQVLWGGVGLVVAFVTVPILIVRLTSGIGNLPPEREQTPVPTAIAGNAASGNDDSQRTATPRSVPTHSVASPTRSSHLQTAVSIVTEPPSAINLSSRATASASSVLMPEQTQKYGLVRFDPGNALDRDPATSWVEGVIGPGVDEQLALVFPSPITINRLGIDVGFDRDEDIFFANNRVRKARLIFADGTNIQVGLEDKRGIQYISIKNITSSSVVIVIEDVYQGTLYNDTPIAEIEVWGYESP